MPRTVLISTSSFAQAGDEPLRRLAGAGFEVRLNPHGRTLERDELVGLLEGVTGLVAGTERLDRPVLESAAGLRVISRCGGGLDGIDLEAARELGIAVRSTPEAPVDAVAELTVGGLLALLRGVARADAAMRRGEWAKPMGRLLGGATVGLVGLGRVGRAVARRLAAFGPRLVAHDPEPDRAFAGERGIAWLGLDDLLATSDVVTLHASAAAGDPPLLDRQRLGRMRRGAFLVNTARGSLVDEAALAERLRSGELAGAYLDVFAGEPYRGELLELPGVLVTPHVGSYTLETRRRMELEAVDNLLLFFRRGNGP